GGGAAIMIIERHASNNQVRPMEAAVTAQLEALGIASRGYTEAGRVAIVPGPAIFENNLVIAFEEIEAIVRVFPCAAAFENVSFARRELAIQAIGVSAAAGRVVIEVRVAVDDLV